MGKYLYGILKEGGERCFGPIGMGKAMVYTIACHDISALASESSPIRPEALPKEELVRLIACHQSVLERFSARWTVLPLKFGTMARDRREVHAILEKGRPQLVAALESARGKVEMEVVALWADLKSQLCRIAQEQGLRPAQESLAGLPPQGIIEAKLELGRRLEEALRGRTEKLRTEILAPLRAPAGDFKLRDCADDSIILNAAFWLDRTAQPAFEAKLRELENRHRGEVYFRGLGPLPPYSFMSAEVRRIDPEVLNRAWQIFGLRQGACVSEVQVKYRDLAREHHPDQRPGDPEASRRFEEITAAYRALMDYCRQGGELAIILPGYAGGEGAAAEVRAGALVSLGGSQP